MRKFLFILLASSFCSFSVTAYSATISVANPSPVKASAVMVPIGPGKNISLQDLANMHVSDYENLSGKKLNFTDRLRFRITQHQLRNSINADGSLNNRKMAKLLRRDGETGFHLGGFVLGLILGFVGVLIAYLIDDENKHNRIKWSWIGAILWALVIFVIIF